jgi:hypothetical protein
MDYFLFTITLRIETKVNVKMRSGLVAFCKALSGKQPTKKGVST